MITGDEGTTWRNRDYLAALALVAAAYICADAPSTVVFDRERIEICVHEGQIQVRGLYHYRNRLPFPATTSLGLPFPVDAEHDRPTTFSITDIGRDGRAGTEVMPRLRHGQVVFRLFFRPREEKWLQVDYVQGTRASRGTYILLTTQKWGKPLARGDYVLHLAPELTLESSNYQLQPDTSTARSYAFSRTNFYPSQDWNFAWHRPMPDSTLAEGRQ